MTFLLKSNKTLRFITCTDWRGTYSKEVLASGYGMYHARQYTYSILFVLTYMCAFFLYMYFLTSKHPSSKSCRKFLGVWCFSWLCWNRIKVLNDNNASFQGQTKLLFICLIKSEFTRHFASIVQIKCHDPERKLKKLNILTIRRLWGLMQKIGKTMLTVRRQFFMQLR